MNLTEQNGGKISDRETLLKTCKAAAIISTLQAGYTNFKYLSDATRKITEREALIGVSITGWMANPHILFDEQNMKDGASEVLYWNSVVADLIGINHAARTTCAKPSGNASVILQTDSGIHGAHSPRYFRNVQMTKEDEVAVLLKKINPDMVEESVWSPGGTDLVVSFPVISKETSIYKKNLLGVKQLEYVKKAQQYWVEYGTRLEACVDQKLRHNISNTISVDDWDEVEEYLFENRQWFAGVSLLSSSGDKIYPQAPFTEVRTETEIVQDYGPAAIFASGLIVDGLKAFDNDLWKACSAISLENSVDESNLWKLDWVRRAVQFADRYFDSNIEKMTYCLKDCYNLHKWNKLQRSMKNIDFSKELGKQNYVDADTLASQGCAGGACEITF